MLKRFFSVLLMASLSVGALVITPAQAVAAEATQNNRNVSGVVSDAEGPIAGVSVVVKGTTNGAVTNLDGAYSLSNVPVGATLVFSCIGYSDVEVIFDGAPIDVLLEEDTQFLDEVVVTALGISREKKSLGYAVQDVKADELTRGGQATLTDALQGKIAGLTINNSATGAGGSSRVVIRGSSSLSDNNEPLYVVDGVPYDNGGHDINTGSNFGLWGGYDRSGGAFDINPEDIESVSVLKGPTAAALYGSRAGNGVILITTKKGGKGADGKIGVTYNGKFTWSPIAYTLDMQDTYGQGTGGAYAPTTGSWGAEMSSSTTNAAWWDASVQVPYQGDANPYKEYYRTGNSQSNNITIAGGSKENPFRLTLGRDDTQSVIRPTSIQKTSIDLVSKYTLTPWLSFDVKANYINTVGNNRQTLGLYGTSYYITTLPRSIRMQDLADHYLDEVAAAAGEVAHLNWYGPNADYQNPYFVQAQLRNRDIQHKFFGMGAVNVKFSDHLNLRIKEGLSWVDFQKKMTYPYKDPVFTGNYPAIEMTKATTTELNSEALLSYNNRFGDFDFGASVGGNIMHYKYESVYGNGRNIPFVGAMYITAGTQYASNGFTEKEVQSAYAFANLGYKDWLFLDVTARNDWSSTLPKDNRSYFYPSVSLSGLVTGFMDAYGIGYNHDVIDYGKIRLSWAMVGKDTAPYQLINTYGTTTDAYGQIYITQPTTSANAELKPEMATSFEIGTEWHFFKNRLGLDVTYYNTTTKNQVMAVDMPYSTGVQKKYINAGVIQNQGVEIQLNGDIIRKRDFELGATLNLAKNINKVKELYHTDAANVTLYELGHMTGSAGVYVYAVEGEPLGDIYGSAYKRDAQGNKVIGADGMPLRDNNVKIGNVNPDFTGSFGLHARYKRLGVNALFQFRKGGEIFSVTEYAAAKAGTAKRTGDRADQVIKGVTESGAANTTAIKAESFWTNAIDEEFIYDASFLKLGELSLTYQLPQSFLDRYTKGVVDNASISAFGSNLFYLISKTPGTTPDGSAIDTAIFSTAFDMCPYPSTRTFGISLNIGF